MSESEDFKGWLKRNRSILMGRAPDEVAFLARLCGFAAEVVYSQLSHYECAIRGGSIERMTDQYIKNEVYELHKRAGAIDLYPQWSALKDYSLNGRCVEDKNPMVISF